MTPIWWIGQGKACCQILICFPICHEWTKFFLEELEEIYKLILETQILEKAISQSHRENPKNTSLTPFKKLLSLSLKIWTRKLILEEYLIQWKTTKQFFKPVDFKEIKTWDQSFTTFISFSNFQRLFVTLLKNETILWIYASTAPFSSKNSLRWLLFGFDAINLIGGISWPVVNIHTNSEYFRDSKEKEKSENLFVCMSVCLFVWSDLPLERVDSNRLVFEVPVCESVLQNPNLRHKTQNKNQRKKWMKWNEMIGMKHDTLNGSYEKYHKQYEVNNFHETQ